jgi:hypothetical protein
MQNKWEPMMWDKEKVNIGVDFCSLVSEELGADSTIFSGSQTIQNRLNEASRGADQVRDTSALVTWKEGCDLALKQFGSSPDHGGMAETAHPNEHNVLADLAQGNLHMPFKTALFFAAGSQPSISASSATRRLLARAGRSRGKSTESSSALKLANISGLRWNISDVEIISNRIRDGIMPTRNVGHGNTVVGGLLVHQVRMIVSMSSSAPPKERLHCAQ